MWVGMTTRFWPQWYVASIVMLVYLLNTHPGGTSGDHECDHCPSKLRRRTAPIESVRREYRSFRPILSHSGIIIHSRVGPHQDFGMPLPVAYHGPRDESGPALGRLLLDGRHRDFELGDGVHHHLSVSSG